MYISTLKDCTHLSYLTCNPPIYYYLYVLIKTSKIHSIRGGTENDSTRKLLNFIQPLTDFWNKVLGNFQGRKYLEILIVTL